MDPQNLMNCLVTLCQQLGVEINWDKSRSLERVPRLVLHFKVHEYTKPFFLLVAMVTSLSDKYDLNNSISLRLRSLSTINDIPEKVSHKYSSINKTIPTRHLFFEPWFFETSFFATLIYSGFMFLYVPSVSEFRVYTGGLISNISHVTLSHHRSGGQSSERIRRRDGHSVLC